MIEISENLKRMMSESEINNSFDPGATDESLEYILHRSWSYLYRVERNLIHFEKFYYPESRASLEDIQYGDLYLDDRGRVCFKLDVDIVKHNGREDFYSEYADHVVELTRDNAPSFYHKNIVVTDANEQKTLIPFTRVNQEDYIGRTVTMRFPMYRNEFTMTDIRNNPDIFSRQILVTMKTGIKRNCLFNISMKMENGKLTVILPYKVNFLYDYENGIINHQLSVLLVDNDFYQKFTTNKTQLHEMSLSDSTVGVTAEKVGLTTFNPNGTYVACVKLPSDDAPSLFATCDIIDRDSTRLRMNFSANTLIDIDNESGAIEIYLMFIKDMYEYTPRDGSAVMGYMHPRNHTVSSPICVIEKSDGHPFNLPIPVEDILVLKRISDGSTYNGQYEMYDIDADEYGRKVYAEVHYPNHYLVKDDNMEVGDMYRILYFYNETAIEYKYKSRWDYFYRYVKQTFHTYSEEEAINILYNNTPYTTEAFNELCAVFRKLFSYDPFDYRYDNIDFVKKFDSDEFIEHPNPGTGMIGYIDPETGERIEVPVDPLSSSMYEYQVKRLKDFIAEDSNNLRDYVKIQKKISEVYYMYASDVDLESRIRTDTTRELHNDTYVFDEEMYLFVFVESDESEDTIIYPWVDGLLAMDMRQYYEDGLYFIYIPTRLVNENSYIELEVRHSFTFRSTIYIAEKGPSGARYINLGSMKSGGYWEECNQNDTGARYVVIDSEYDASDVPNKIRYSELPKAITGTNGLKPRTYVRYVSFQVPFSSDVIPTLEDITFYDESNPDVELDKSLFNVSRCAYDSDFATNDGGNPLAVFTTMDSIKIEALDDSVADRNIIVAIKKVGMYRNLHMTRRSYPNIGMNTFNVPLKEGYVKLYRNGRAIPESMIAIVGNGRRMQALFELQDGDNFGVDISPFKSRLVYSLDRIPEYRRPIQGDTVTIKVVTDEEYESAVVKDSLAPISIVARDIPDIAVNEFVAYDNRYAIINLVDDEGEPILNKPFDIKYYDVFLNGRKLNETNCFGEGETILHIINVNSRYCLEIYERERDEEYYGWKSNDTQYFFELDELLTLTTLSEDDKHWIIDDIIRKEIEDRGRQEYEPIEHIEDTELENKEDVIYDADKRMRIFYYEELLPKRLGQPEETQFDNSEVDEEEHGILEQLYPETCRDYLIEDSPIANAANEGKRSMRKVAPMEFEIIKLTNSILYLDPDKYFEMAGIYHAPTDVFFTGDYDDACEKLEQEG